MTPSDLGGLIEAREPTVIRGFLRGAAFEGADVVDRVRETPIALSEEFVSWSLRRGGAVDTRPRYPSSVGAYLRLLESDPGTPLMCTEFPTPASLLEGLGEWPRALAGGEPPVSFTFVGGRGKHAHLHYDGDFRNVLLVQLFGHKRATLIPATSSHLVQPVANFSGVFLDRLAETQRADFARLAGGWSLEIGPGDALFMPAGLWHFLHYPDTGMSINLRFGANPSNQRMAGRFHLHDSLQRLAWHFADGHEASEEEIAGVDRLIALAGAARGDSRAHGAAVEAMTASLAQAWTGASPPAVFSGNAEALREAATRANCAALYPPVRVPLDLALSGWMTAER